MNAVNNAGLVCDICPLAEQNRLPFPNVKHLCKFPFDLIHIDTWGPFSVPTLDGFRYILTTVDDCTRTIWVYLMKHNFDAKFLLETFFTMVETQFHCKIKSLRSDNAPEFELKTFLAP